MKRIVLANLISSSSDHSSPRKFAFGLALVLLIALLVAAGVNARAWLNKIAGTIPSAPTAVVELKKRDQEARSNPTPTRLDSVLITINQGGFYPAALSRPKGKFFLLVENRSEVREVDLRLDRVTGNRLREVKAPSGQLDWTELLDLNPGEYRLTEAKHPNWVCHIIITSQ
jgi:hypothetical protein